MARARRRGGQGRPARRSPEARSRRVCAGRRADHLRDRAVDGRSDAQPVPDAEPHWIGDADSLPHGIRDTNSFPFHVGNAEPDRHGDTVGHIKSIRHAEFVGHTQPDGDDDCHPERRHVLGHVGPRGRTGVHEDAADTKADPGPDGEPHTDYPEVTACRVHDRTGHRSEGSAGRSNSSDGTRKSTGGRRDDIRLGQQR